MISLSSSAIRGVEYDADTRELRITFTSGGTYTFHGVPFSVYRDLVNSSSPGSYYNTYIRGRYR